MHLTMCTIVVIHVHVHCNLKIKTIVTFTLTQKRLKFDTLKLSNQFTLFWPLLCSDPVLVFQEPYPTYDPVLYTKPLDEYKDSVQTLVDPDFIE